MKTTEFQHNLPDLDVLAIMRSITNVKQDQINVTTVDAWANHWLAHYCANLKKTTLRSYRFAVNVHINRVLGNILLTKLTSEDVQLFINSLWMGIGLSTSMSPKTVKNVHGVLHKCLEVAVTNHHISVNPASLSILPRLEKPEITPFSIDALGAFLSAIQGHAKELLFIVAVFTGMRQGELVGLTWDCIDFNAGTIYVYRQIIKENSQYKFSSLKNSKPRKLFPAAVVIALLKKEKEKENFPNSEFVFNSQTGTHYTHTSVYRSFKRIVNKMGYPDMRFHDLRHTYAVLSLQAGDDIKTLQSNMGHHSAAFTLDVYGHCQIEMKKASSCKMEKFIDDNFAKTLSTKEVEKI